MGLMDSVENLVFGKKTQIREYQLKIEDIKQKFNIRGGLVDFTLNKSNGVLIIKVK